MSASGTCEDSAGNISTPVTVENIMIDTTEPVITINTPSLYDVQPLGTALDFSANDGLSGVHLVLATLLSENESTEVVPSGYQPQPGVYQVLVTATDRAGNVTVSNDRLLVIYDPSGGYATGGGWIMSDEGACPAESICGGATGKTNFGFVSKYKKGASEPTGHTQFNFKAGNLNFQSAAYDWLVVNQGGANAQYKGSGSINGENGYKFMLWAGDGLGTSGADTFRIRIWYEDGNQEITVYDNGFHQAIGGGNIRVHK
jgi:hypothetical protein